MLCLCDTGFLPASHRCSAPWKPWLRGAPPYSRLGFPMFRRRCATLEFGIQQFRGERPSQLQANFETSRNLPERRSVQVTYSGPDRQRMILKQRYEVQCSAMMCCLIFLSDAMQICLTVCDIAIPCAALVRFLCRILLFVLLLSAHVSLLRPEFSVLAVLLSQVEMSNLRQVS